MLERSQELIHLEKRHVFLIVFPTSFSHVEKIIVNEPFASEGLCDQLTLLHVRVGAVHIPLFHLVYPPPFISKLRCYYNIFFVENLPISEEFLFCPLTHD